MRDIRLAYQAFGLAFPANNLDDDTIIGTFQARVSDAPKQEPELRRALVIIGQSRSSAKIQHIASNSKFSIDSCESGSRSVFKIGAHEIISYYDLRASSILVECHGKHGR